MFFFLHFKKEEKPLYIEDRKHHNARVSGFVVSLVCILYGNAILAQSISFTISGTCCIYLALVCLCCFFVVMLKKNLSIVRSIYN